MLKDIRNEINIKRNANKNNSDNFTGGLLMNAKNGQEYKIENDKEFSIGRFLNSSLVLESAYISRRHCIIRYEDNRFIIFDNNSNSGTYLNFGRLEKGITNYEVLNDGDLITFGEPKKMDFIFKFSLIADVDIIPRFDNNRVEVEADQQHKQMIEYSRQSINMMHTQLLSLKAEKDELRNLAKRQFTEFQEMFKLAQEIIKKNNTEMLKKTKIIEELTKDSECLKTKVLLLQDEYKNQINNILENDLQCSICNEVVIKIHTANCNHSFCECCIKQWLSRNQICPICRTRVKDTVNSLAVDNFVTNLCNLMGGTVKEQRDNLTRERKESEQPKKRGRGRQRRRENIIGAPPVRNRIGFMPYPVIRDDAIEIVDLTNMSR